MKLVIILIVLGAVLSFFGPWWSIAVVSFVACYQLATSGKMAFGWSAFSGIFIWSGFSLLRHIQAEAPITQKMAGLFQYSISALQGVPSLGVVLLFVVLVSGIVGGFSGLAGYQVKQLFK